MCEFRRDFCRVDAEWTVRVDDSVLNELFVYLGGDLFVRYIIEQRSESRIALSTNQEVGLLTSDSCLQGTFSVQCHV
jgi:hypothetical protein